MNVYDFDKTILNTDSTQKFYFYCLNKYPAILTLAFKTLFAFVKYVFGIIDKTAFKETMYLFLTKLPDVDKEVGLFWEKNQNRIYDWYIAQHRDDDVIISASPEFLLRPVCEKLGIKNLIASRVDKKTGKYTGKNCWGDEKVIRFYEEFPDADVEAFYSDSFSDTPMANISRKSYIITHGVPVEWASYRPSMSKKLKHMVFTCEFIAFGLIGCINVCDGVLFEYLLSLIIYPNIAFIIGYLISLSISYLLNSKLTFHTAPTVTRYIKFLISYIPNFAIQNLCVLLLYNTLGIDELFAYIAAAIIGVPVTFAAVKLFAFGGK